MKRRERYRVLRAKLMEQLDTRGDAGDDEIRGMIDALVLESSRSDYLPIADRVSLGRELFASVRRLDILQDLIDDKKVTEQCDETMIPL